MPEELDKKIFPHGQKPGSLELAFVGDSLYDLYVLARLAIKGGKVNDLNRTAVSKVNAHAQREGLERIEPLLTEEELSVVRRAKNAKQSPTKNADPEDYCRATALEALLGYLYLTGQNERMTELLSVSTGLPKEGINPNSVNNTQEGK